MSNVVEIVIHAVNESKAAFSEIEAQNKSVGSSFASFGAIAGVALGAVAIESLKMASTFNSAVTRLGTSAGESQANLKLVSDGMLNMASQVGTSADELAKGMYTVESAGYHGADGLKVLKAAAQGAKDENANLADVANATTDVLKDYHMKASDAGNVTSQMVKAVSYGKTTFEEFSKSLSQVVPIAAAAHIKFQDVSGVLAEMTSHGIPAQQAAQNISRAISSLLNPSAVMTKEFGKLGISTKEVQEKLGTAGLGGTMQWLSGVADKGAASIGQNHVQAMAKLMGTSAGLRVALMTTGENAKDTTDAIAGIGKASVDARGNVEGFSAIQQTLGFKWDSFTAGLKTDAIRIGDALTPIAGAIMDKIGGVFSFLSTHKDVLIVVATVITGVLVAAFTAWTISAATAAATTLAAAWPFLAVAAAIGALGVVIKKIWDTNEGFRKFVKEAWADIQIVIKTAWTNFIQPTFVAIWSFITNTLAPTLVWFWKNIIVPVWTGIYTAIKIAWDIISVIFQAYVYYVQNVLAPIVTWLWKSVISPAWTGISSAIKIAWTIIVGIFDIFKYYINSVVAPVVTWLWKNIIAPAFSAIGSVISSAWNNIIKPALSALGSFVTNYVAPGIQTGINAIKTVWNTLKDIFKAPINFVIGTVYDGGIVKFWNAIMNVVSGPKLSTIPTLSTGGRLSGYGGGDQHLALLEAGEAVVDKDRTKKFAPLLKAMGVPGFDIGGIVGGVGNVLSDIGGGIKNAASTAWDITTDVGKAAADIATGNIDGLINLIAGHGAKGTGGAAGGWGSAISSFPKTIASKLGNFAKSLASSISGGITSALGISGGSGVGQYAGLVGQVLSMLGQSPVLQGVALRQMQTESGGNPTVVNKWDSNWIAGTPSVGLMQVIGPTFREYAGPFAGTGPFEYGVSVNPLANIYAGLNYAVHRYGSSWASVLGHGHGYDSGGWLPTGLSLAYNGTGKPERVVGPNGANEQKVVLEINSSGSPIDEFLTQLIRNIVRIKGAGNVQTAFGRS